MKISSTLVTLFVLLFGCLTVKGTTVKESHAINPAEPNEGCGPCDETKCRPPNPEEGQEQCLAGVVKDICGCCFVCALREAQRCHPLPSGTAGPRGCGENLECQLRTDLPVGESPEAICICIRQEPLCASDGKTYANECQLTEARYMKRTEDKADSRKRRFVGDNTLPFLMGLDNDDQYTIRAVSRGPCKTAPKIVSSPEDVTNHTGSFVALSCEATGWPVPSIEWIVEHKNSEPNPLPSDDPHIAVQSRGGPSHYEVTSWLQLLKVVPEDQGTYWCVAKNEVGQDKAAGKVTVLPSKQKQSTLHHLIQSKPRFSG